MKIILFLTLIVILSTMVNAEVNHYYEVKLKYSNGNISYDSIQIKPVTAENKLENIPGGFIASIVSFDDEILNITTFDIPLMVLYDNVDKETGEIVGGGLTYLNKSETTIRVPYYENAKEINIYDENINKKLTIDVLSYAKDITIKPEIEPSGKLEEEILFKKEIEKKPINYRLFLIVGLALIMILFAIFLKKKVKK